MHPGREGTLSSARYHDRLDAGADAGDGLPDPGQIPGVQGVAYLGAIKGDPADPVLVGNERLPHGEASLTPARSGRAGMKVMTVSGAASKPGCHADPHASMCA